MFSADRHRHTPAAWDGCPSRGRKAQSVPAGLWGPEWVGKPVAIHGPTRVATAQSSGEASLLGWKGRWV